MADIASLELLPYAENSGRPYEAGNNRQTATINRNAAEFQAGA